jgi:hypothetical protein
LKKGVNNKKIDQQGVRAGKGSTALDRINSLGKDEQLKGLSQGSTV